MCTPRLTVRAQFRQFVVADTHETGPVHVFRNLVVMMGMTPGLTCSSGKMPVARCLSYDKRPGRKTIAVLIDYIDQISDGFESSLAARYFKAYRPANARRRVTAS